MSDPRSIEALRGVPREEWALAFMEDPSLADSVLAEVDELAARAERYREALRPFHHEIAAGGTVSGALECMEQRDWDALAALTDSLADSDLLETK